jgi:hypothetical protein
VEVRRFNLAQEPIEFVRNAAVKAALESEGTAVLPLIFVDGQVAFKGRYPEQIERAEPMRQARDESRSAALM